MLKHAQLSAHEIRGPVSQLLTNLDGDDSGLWLTALKRFLRKENAWDGRPLWAVWKTITIGSTDSLDQLIKKIRDNGMDVRGYTEDLLHNSKMEFSGEMQDVDLVKLTLEEMGFRRGDVTYPEIIRRVKQLGLGLCTAEMALVTRLCYPEQPRIESLRNDDRGLLPDFAMEPLIHGGKKNTLGLVHDEEGEMVLCSVEVSGGDTMGLKAEYICVLPK